MKFTFNNLQNANAILSFLSLMIKQEQEKRQRYFNYLFDGNVWNMPRVNRLYRDFRIRWEQMGMKEFNCYLHLDRQGNILNEQEKFRSDIYIHTAISQFRSHIEFSIRWDNGEEERYSFEPNSNELISNELIIKLVLRYVDKKLLFPEGNYRDIQKEVWVNKQTLIKSLKDDVWYRKTDNYRWEAERNRENAIKEYILKRFNYYNDYMDAEELLKHAIRLSKIKPRPEEPKPIYQFDNSFMFDDFEGDIDEMEDRFYDEIENQSKNCELVFNR